MAEEIKDAEFKEFLAQIRKDPADMGKLKAGMEKFGMGYFTDSQKEAILKEIFPSQTPTKTPKDERLGFQNMQGIKNTLMAMQELHSEGKIDDTKMTAFLTMNNPETGKNMMTTIAVQTRAAEFKRKGATDSNSQQKLDENLKIAADIQETLGQVKYHVLKTAINTPDSSTKPMKYSDYTKTAQGQKSIVFNTVKSVQAQSQLFPVVSSQKETGLVKFEDKERGVTKVEDQERGLTETKESKAPATVDGTQSMKFGNFNGNPLEVQGGSAGETPNPENTDTPDNVAHLGDAGPDSKEGKKEHSGNLGTVREQDIIDYMFQNWFLGGVNLILDGTYKVFDRGLDAFLGAYENAPKSSVAATLGGGAALSSGATAAGAGRAAETGSAAQTGENGPAQSISYAAQIGALSNQSISAYQDIMQQLSGPYADVYAETLLKNIEKNIGKDASKWQCEGGVLPNGEKVIPLRPTGKNRDIINRLNVLKRANPQAFDKMMRELRKNPQALATNMNMSRVKWASVFATLDYASAHPKAELVGNDEAQKKVGKYTSTRLTELMGAEAQYMQAEKEKYIKEHPEAKNRPLTKKEEQDIAKAATENMTQYLGGVIGCAETLQTALIAYHQDQSAENKKALDEAKKAYEESFMNYTRDDDKGRDNGSGKKDIREAANDEKAGRQKEQAYTDDINGKKESIEGQREKTDKRKVQVKKFKANISQRYQAKQQRATVLPMGKKDNTYS